MILLLRDDLNAVSEALSPQHGHNSGNTRK